MHKIFRLVVINTETSLNPPPVSEDLARPVVLDPVATHADILVWVGEYHNMD